LSCLKGEKNETKIELIKISYFAYKQIVPENVANEKEKKKFFDQYR